jgi:NAD(P)-dependent dehydrogenase (short-subunit alcohol dehydrogenase family)
MLVDAMATLDLGTFGSGVNAAVVGASGGIGGAIVDHLCSCQTVSKVFSISRSAPDSGSTDEAWIPLDLEDDDSIAAAAETVKRSVKNLHIVIVATGALHDDSKLQPEKTWRSLSGSAMEIAFRINAIGPALVAKNFLPLLAKDRKTAFAGLSARVGSIEDNHLGGWHAYRASKAALNMLIKTLAIELAQRRPKALCVGLHPGTVDTALSKPFQRGLRQGQLFSPTQSARHLLTTLDRLTPPDSGHLYAWDGSCLPF